jgi:hypothetical protein
LGSLDILKKYQFDETIYPKLEFKISREELSRFVRYDPNEKIYEVMLNSNSDPLVRLLYAVLWKNRDVKKINHVIQGIMNAEDAEKDDGLVFYQFGKFLSSSTEPIIDQHVIRAFGIYKSRNNQKDLDYYVSLNTLSRRDKPIIGEYKKWLEKDLSESLRQQNEYRFKVDKILYGLGKYAKDQYRKTNNSRSKA